MNKTRGFTLVELVVVVLILGILAAIAAPKLINNSDKALDSSAGTSIQAFRDAIEFYRAENSGALPPSTTATAFTTALDPYLRGASFPKSPVHATDSQAADIDITTTTVLTATATATKGWKYSSVTGDVIINSVAPLKAQPGITYDQL